MKYSRNLNTESLQKTNTHTHKHIQDLHESQAADTLEVGRERTDDLLCACTDRHGRGWFGMHVQLTGVGLKT